MAPCQLYSLKLRDKYQDRQAWPSGPDHDIRAVATMGKMLFGACCFPFYYIYYLQRLTIADSVVIWTCWLTEQ